MIFTEYEMIFAAKHVSIFSELYKDWQKLVLILTDAVKEKIKIYKSCKTEIFLMIYMNYISILAAVMNEGAVSLTINHQNYPNVKLAGLVFLANRFYKGQRTLKMAGNGSSARLKIAGVKTYKKYVLRVHLVISMWVVV